MSYCRLCLAFLVIYQIVCQQVGKFLTCYEIFRTQTLNDSTHSFKFAIITSQSRFNILPKSSLRGGRLATERTQFPFDSTFYFILKIILYFFHLIFLTSEQEHHYNYITKSDIFDSQNSIKLSSQINLFFDNISLIQRANLMEAQYHKKSYSQPLIAPPTEKELFGMSQNCKQSIRGLTQALNQPVIDLRKLRAYLANGIPEQIWLLRQLAWKVILGYLPRTRDKWQQQQQKQEQHYMDFVKHYLPEQKYQNYPLMLTKQDEKWPEHEKDFYLWQQIEKDTSRTQSQLAFFSTPADPMMVPYMTAVRKEKWKMVYGEDKDVIKNWKERKEEHRITYRFDYMTRILFVFAKVNPRAQYVQGMNQILGPIFYLLNYRNKGPVQEAACFFMFNNVMSDLLELNIEDFDKRQNGIHARMKQVDRILLATEPALWQKMNSLKIDQVYYCFRWLTLLFAQEFELYEILRIWQSIFACEDRALYVNCFAVALLSGIKPTILSGSYSSVLTCIKKIRENVNYNESIFRAFELYHEFRGLDVNTMAQYNFKKLENKEMRKSKSQKPKIFQKIMKKFI